MLRGEPASSELESAEIVDRYLRAIEGGAARTADFEDLEERFIACAREFGMQHGIDRATWIEVGTSTTVLDKAGIR